MNILQWEIIFKRSETKRKCRFAYFQRSLDVLLLILPPNSQNFSRLRKAPHRNAAVFLLPSWISTSATSRLQCASISSSSCSRSLLSWPGLSRVTLGQFEDLARPDFTCRPIYERCGGALHTSFPRPCLTAVCLSWICNGSHLGERLRFRRGGRWTEWVQARWAVTDRPPPPPPLPLPAPDLWPPHSAPRATSPRAGPRRRPSESQPVVGAMMPADLLFNRPWPPVGGQLLSSARSDERGGPASSSSSSQLPPHHHHPDIVI